MNRRTILLAAARPEWRWPGAGGRRSGRCSIGVLNDMSGVFADYQGPGSLAATQMAVEDARGDGRRAGGRARLRRPPEQAGYRHGDRPQMARQDGVDVVMDVPNSASRWRWRSS